MATIYKRGKRWRAEVRRRGIYRSETFARKLDAQEWAAALEREIEAGRGQLRQSMTLREVMHDYARDVTPTKRGARNERIRLDALCRESFGDRDISTICARILAEWRDRRLSIVSNGSVLRDITLLSSVFEYARRERRLIDANPVRDLRKPSAPRPRNRLPSSDEIERLCLALGYQECGQKIETFSAQVAVALLLAIESAMRAGEILSLTWDQVDTTRRVAALSKTKNGDARQVPLSLRAVELLEQMRGIDPVRVFTVSAASRDALFRKAKKRAGIEGLTFHDSRALALTRLAKKLDVLELARMVGHRDVRSLMVYYRESAEEIAKKL